jgi:hypothetical protein
MEKEKEILLMKKFEKLIYERFCIIFCTVILKTILKTITSFPSLTISLLFPTHQHGYEKTNEHVPIKVHDIYINSIKFDINTNNDELLKTI